MPRYARKYQKNNTNVYHVILRSINQQEIFYDDVDRHKFIEILSNNQKKYLYDLYAYVLMDNHVHFLLMDKENILSTIMQSLETSYAIYFNKKYERIGHVFYNRFKSNQVDTLSYFMNLIRYIHFNPQKAQICKYSEYMWSSYQKYFSNQRLISSEKFFKMTKMNTKDFVNFHEEYSKKKKFELENFEMDKINLDDETAIQLIKKLLNIDNLISIQNMKSQERNEIIAKIAQIEGINRKQLARILGLNIRMIYRAISKEKGNNT